MERSSIKFIKCDCRQFSLPVCNFSSIEWALVSTTVCMKNISRVANQSTIRVFSENFRGWDAHNVFWKWRKNHVRLRLINLCKALWKWIFCRRFIDKIDVQCRSSQMIWLAYCWFILRFNCYLTPLPSICATLCSKYDEQFYYDVYAAINYK